MTDTRPLIVWFRRDLRVADNPALDAAHTAGRPVLPVYILDDETPGPWAPGGAARWWLHGNLVALSADLTRLGTPLVLRRGGAGAVLDALIAETDAAGVLWNRCYEPHAVARDTAIKADLKARGLLADSFNGSLLHEPWELQTKAGGFHKVYTRYWQAVRALPDPRPPRPAPARLTPPERLPASDDLANWGLLPTRPDWAGGLRDRWAPGAAAALERLDTFLDDAVGDYAAERDIPSKPATSGLSPYLQVGAIGPRQVWDRTVARVGWSSVTEQFLKELVWREFAYHVFHNLPDLPSVPMNPRFADFPWAENAAALGAWQRGMTGYPMVDAGMRELWQTGVMHNRVRMVAASFLVKHLLQPWQSGEAWFRDTLVDADLAVNAFNWQWVAGCGADAAPYFRIFNPIAQGEKFDPDGLYVRTYVPEIAALPDKYLHQPWTAPADVLAAAGVRLGETYPKPIIGHREGRERALAAFASIKAGG